MRVLMVAILLSACTAHPAIGQYMYIDANGDGICTEEDVLTAASDSVDVWLDTNHNADGSDAECVPNSLDEQYPWLWGYSVILRAGPCDQSACPGYVTWGTWTNAPTGFGLLNFSSSSGGVQNHFYVSYGNSRTPQDGPAPGRHKLGTLTFTQLVPGTVLEISSSAPGAPTNPFSGFMTYCQSNDFDAALKLGDDFTDWCGTSPAIPSAVEGTTWGKIKLKYR